jgi:murein DD-endopeptidase MepM/ murein hydrolase activator NlpD
MTYRRRAVSIATVALISLIAIATPFMPATVRASVISDFFASLIKTAEPENTIVSGATNIETMQLLKPAMNIDPTPARGGGGITIVNDTALMPQEGPSGTLADIEKPKNATVSRYVVREGDTLGGISKMFSVSANTILWANDLPRSSSLKVGQVLTILPVTGVKYTTQKGDTLATIAKRFGGDADEIASFNGIDSTLAAGTDIIIPDGEIAVVAPKKISVSAKISEPAHNVGPTGDASQVAYYIAPLSHYVRTQGVHGYNAVDLAAPIGTPILAAATGDVVVARAGGWNGGYGSYVVMQHSNGAQTLYGHASKIIVSDGEHVVQGQVIGYVGQTGKATGPHVHFEIRNGIKNPF